MKGGGGGQFNKICFERYKEGFMRGEYKGDIGS